MSKIFVSKNVGSKILQVKKNSLQTKFGSKNILDKEKSGTNGCKNLDFESKKCLFKKNFGSINWMYKTILKERGKILIQQKS